MSPTEVQNYVSERISSNEFKNDFLQMLRNLRDETGEVTVRDALEDISFLFEQRRPELQKAIHSISCDLSEIILDKIGSSGYSGNDVFNTFSKESIKAILLQPVDVPKETLEELIDQPAIRELFTTVIYSSIINFWKKINPLLGAVAAAAAENQIRDFIQPFMPTVISMSVDFVTDEKNNDMMMELNGSVFDVLMEQKADLLNHLPTENSGKLIKEAGYSLIDDDLLYEKLVEQKDRIISAIIDEHGEKTLAVVLEEHDFKLNELELNDNEYALLEKAFLKTNALADFMTKEMQLFAKAID
jgi:hypothetical protein